MFQIRNKFFHTALALTVLLPVSTATVDVVNAKETKPAATTKTDLQLAQEAYGKGDYKTAYKILVQAEKKGASGVLYMLGVMNMLGRSIEKNEAKACDYFEKAATQEAGTTEGFAGAEFNIGLCYMEGIGRTKNEEEGLKWYKLAAEHGDGKAIINLGYYYSDNGPQQNYKEAAKWYQKGADKGHPGAIASLAALYLNGRGVKQDFEKARKLYEQAIEKDPQHGNAYGDLGVIYDKGLGVPRDTDKAIELYKKAAENGVKNRADRLAELLEAQFDVQLVCKTRGQQDVSIKLDTRHLKAQVRDIPAGKTVNDLPKEPPVADPTGTSNSNGQYFNITSQSYDFGTNERKRVINRMTGEMVVTMDGKATTWKCAKALTGPKL